MVALETALRMQDWAQDGMLLRLWAEATATKAATAAAEYFMLTCAVGWCLAKGAEVG